MVNKLTNDVMTLLGTDISGNFFSKYSVYKLNFFSFNLYNKFSYSIFSLSPKSLSFYYEFNYTSTVSSFFLFFCSY